MNSLETKKIVLPECVVYYRHGVIDSKDDLVPFILEAGEEVRANNPDLQCAEPEYCFVSYGSNCVQENKIEIEYAEAVERAGKESENIKFKKLKEKKAISICHKGSYSELKNVYSRALEFVKQNGYVIDGEIRECYIDGCWNKSDESEYLTEIQIPIKQF